MRPALLEIEDQRVCVPIAYREGEHAKLRASENATFDDVICAAANSLAPRPWLVAVSRSVSSDAPFFSQLQELVTVDS